MKRYALASWSIWVMVLGCMLTLNLPSKLNAQSQVTWITVRDPLTGQTCEVQTLQGGPKWTNGSAVVDSVMSPGPAFHQLETISR